ncbi:hypothetical protein AKJ09_07691 [Labilithrix luteola]|uniref:DUF2079 domain-containing protein n=2 Tax=Labilithrix luteola TaxID=1391654 RepID=A0A0K1Q5L4_9BACT|nr:hypothetical protein AKJ09_07691 [Labilithrix luteola]
MTPGAGIAVAKIVAGAYAAGAFAFFATRPADVLDRAVVSNALNDAEQRSLSLTLAIALATAVAYILLFAFRGRKAEDPTRALVDASHEPFLLSPLAVWPLYEAHVDLPVRLICIVVIGGLTVWSVYSFATQSPRGKALDALDGPWIRRAGPWIALAMGLGHALLMMPLSLASIDTLFAGWDIAIFTQMHWNIITSGVPATSMYSNDVINHYGAHFSPIDHLTALAYFFHQTPKTLLVIQSLALGLAPLPTYLLAERLTKKPGVSLLLAAGFVLNPATYGIFLHEYHEICLFVPMMLGLIWAIEVGRMRLAWVLAVLILSIREDTPAYVAVFGAYLWLLGNRRAFATKLMVVAAIYLAAVHVVFMPALRGTAPYVFDDRYLGLLRAGTTGKGAMIGTIVTNPAYTLRYIVASLEKWEYVVEILIPVAFMPIFGRRALLLLVPGFLFSMLSSFTAQYDIHFHYAAPVLPFLYVVTLAGLVRFDDRMQLALVVGAFVSTCLLGGKVGVNPVLNPRTAQATLDARIGRYGDDARAIRAAVAQVPPDACVRATGHLLTPIAHRKGAFIVPWGKFCDWALIDIDASNLPSSCQSERAYLLEHLRSNEFGVVYGDRNVVLIGRGKPTTRNAEYVARLEATLDAPCTR